MSLYVYDKAGAFVAQIHKPEKAAQACPALPWLVLHNSGAVRRCESLSGARDEAQKVYPGCSFRRT